MELHLEAVDIARVTERVLDTFSGYAAGKGLALNCHFSPQEIPWLMLDKIRTRQGMFSCLSVSPLPLLSPCLPLLAWPSFPGLFPTSLLLSALSWFSRLLSPFSSIVPKENRYRAHEVHGRVAQQA